MNIDLDNINEEIIYQAFGVDGNEHPIPDPIICQS